jgi:hypothetical protein
MRSFCIKTLGPLPRCIVLESLALNRNVKRFYLPYLYHHVIQDVTSKRQRSNHSRHNSLIFQRFASPRATIPSTFLTIKSKSNASRLCLLRSRWHQPNASELVQCGHRTLRRRLVEQRQCYHHASRLPRTLSFIRSANNNSCLSYNTGASSNYVFGVPRCLLRRRALVGTSMDQGLRCYRSTTISEHGSFYI